jgi:signal transduction histidine kinase/CheY-like chemotaxis protein
MSYAPSTSLPPASVPRQTGWRPQLRVGLRGRILILLMIAVLPAIGIQAYNEYDLRQARELDIRNQVIQITKQFGEEMGELREGSRQLLLALGQLPAVRDGNTAQCGKLLRMLETQYANYSVLGAADAHGRIYCSSVERLIGASVVEDEFFKRAIERDGLAVGNYRVDPVTGVKQIHFALHFADKDGVAGVVFAGLDLKWLAEHLKERGLSATASILIADRLGNIIARLPNGDALVGKNMRKGHAEIMDGYTAGWEEAKGVDGIERIFGYVPAQLPPYDLFLSSGQAKAEAIAPLERATQRGIALIGLGVALAALLSWYGSHIFISRPVGSLLEATRQWRNGNYDQRVPVRDLGSEFGALAQAFNEMADGLAARDRAQRQAEEKLRQLNATLEERVIERTNELTNANQLLKQEITQRERAQAELMHAQKIEAIGQLTSGIAHDFNNLLTAILGSLTIARRRAQDEKSAKALDTAMRAGRRGAKLVRDLLAFSRRQRLDLQSIQVNEVLTGTEELLERTLGSMVRVEMNRDEALWPAMTDPGQLELAVLNLAINARDAMPAGGTLTISTCNVPAGNPRLPEDVSGDCVMVSVADTGTGMSEEVRAKVFEPFFTTKSVGKGSGLGLSMVYGLVKQCRGAIAIDSRVGHGTTVSLFFPRAHCQFISEPESAAADGMPVRPAQPGAKLLIVDDDSDVREFAATALRDAGYDVFEAKDAASGLELLAAHREIAVLITDYAMPLMTGADLFRRAKTIRPDLAALLITGFANLPREDQAISGMRLLRKPFDVPDMLRAVNQCLEQGALQSAA